MAFPAPPTGPTCSIIPTVTESATADRLRVLSTLQIGPPPPGKKVKGDNCGFNTITAPLAGAALSVRLKGTERRDIKSQRVDSVEQPRLREHLWRGRGGPRSSRRRARLLGATLCYFKMCEGS